MVSILDAARTSGRGANCMAKRATCQINSTADTRDIVIDVLTHLPDVKVKILSNREEALRDLKK